MKSLCRLWSLTALIVTTEGKAPECDLNHSVSLR